MTPLEDITKSSPIALLKPRNFPRRLNINVGTLTGRTFQLSVMSTDTIAEIKSRIQDEEGISAETQILVFREQELKDNAQLFSLGVQDGSTIQLVVHMTGGR
ncbi:ubiquitin-related domain-containing protein [Gorgonomyces haynaldii]|nr:ubiquitin-related domain-containing protein [Gorgonomyces haynaldii]